MKYFREWPIIKYPLLDENERMVEGIDIHMRQMIPDFMRDNIHMFEEYTISAGDRPDQIAQKYYDDVHYAWVVMLSCEYSDWGYDLPLSDKHFNEYFKLKYGGTIDEKGQEIHHYDNGSGIIIDKATYDNLTNPHRKAVTNFDYEYFLNDQKRYVKLLKKQYIPTLERFIRNKIQSYEDAREGRN